MSGKGYHRSQNMEKLSNLCWSNILVGIVLSNSGATISATIIMHVA